MPRFRITFRHRNDRRVKLATTVDAETVNDALSQLGTPWHSIVAVTVQCEGRNRTTGEPCRRFATENACRDHR